MTAESAPEPLRPAGGFGSGRHLTSVFPAAHAPASGIFGTSTVADAAPVLKIDTHAHYLPRDWPDLARKYRVMAVPKVVINDRVQFEGALPEREFLRKVLEAVESDGQAPA